MRVIAILLCVCALLNGCAAAPVFETVGDVFGPQTAPEPKKIEVTLPEDAAAQTITGEQGTLYLCNGYEVTQQILPGGDLSATLRELTGFERDRLTLLQTRQEECNRYSCAWSAVGEAGETVGRAVILDDGCYHYCLTVMADADEAGLFQDIWQDILQSYGVV